MAEINREWQWWMTFRILRPDDRRKVKNFLRVLQLVEGIQLAYLETFSPREMKVHVLAVGHSGKTGKSLQTVSKEYWARKWSIDMRLRTGALIIKDVYDGRGLEEYTTIKHFQRDPDTEVSPYNLRLLRKFDLSKGFNRHQKQ